MVFGVEQAQNLNEKKRTAKSLGCFVSSFFLAKSVNFFARGIESTKLFFKYNTQSALLVMVVIRLFAVCLFS